MSEQPTSLRQKCGCGDVGIRFPECWAESVIAHFAVKCTGCGRAYTIDYDRGTVKVTKRTHLLVVEGGCVGGLHQFLEITDEEPA